MWLLLCWSLIGVAGVKGQTPPPTPCPEVFQYWFQDGQWSGHVVVPVEEGVEEITLVTSLYIANVFPPVPGGLHAAPRELQKVSSESSNSTSSIEFKLIFPVQLPIPLLDKIMVNNKVVCQGIPVKVRYVSESTCSIQVSKFVESESTGAFEDCDVYQTVWRVVDGEHVETEESSTLEPRVNVLPDANTDFRTEPSEQLFTTLPTREHLILTNEVQSLCPESEQNLRARGKAACGIPTGPVRTIYNGMATRRGDWPWLVAFYTKTSMEFLCGGSLLSRQHVVTAAHCFSDPNTGQPLQEGLLAHMGKYDLMRRDEPNVQCRQIAAVIKHPNYKEATLENDIAIIILEVKVKFTDYVIPVCLWKSELSVSGQLIGSVVGWGKEERTMMISNTPRVAMVPLVSQQICRDSHLFYKDYVSDRTLCAGNMNGTGPCLGDSGGGLVVRMLHKDGRTRWHLRGIVSFNLQGNKKICHLNEYSLYTDVAHYVDWLMHVMRSSTARISS